MYQIPPKPLSFLSTTVYAKKTSLEKRERQISSRSNKEFSLCRVRGARFREVKVTRIIGKQQKKSQKRNGIIY